jgi:hypothetical protein
MRLAPLGRKAISGNVKLDGAAGAGQHRIPSAVRRRSSKRRGNYPRKRSIPAHEGAVVGKHRVAITDFVSTPPLPPGHMPGDTLPPSPKPKVPASWNSKSQQTVEVKKEGPFKIDFEIVTKKKWVGAWSVVSCQWSVVLYWRF